jgi:hypothetical protein
MGSASVARYDVRANWIPHLATRGAARTEGRFHLAEYDHGSNIQAR